MKAEVKIPLEFSRHAAQCAAAGNDNFRFPHFKALKKGRDHMNRRLKPVSDSRLRVLSRGESVIALPGLAFSLLKK